MYLPREGVLITLYDPKVGHLNILWMGMGIWRTENFKFQMPGGLPVGDIEASNPSLTSRSVYRPRNLKLFGIIIYPFSLARD